MPPKKKAPAPKKTPVKEKPVAEEKPQELPIEEPKPLPPAPSQNFIEDLPKETIAMISDPEKEKKTLSEEEKAQEEKANVIKLNQFNNFTQPAKQGMTEDDKKKLRELRFSAKNSTENTFEISHVAEQEKAKMQDRAKRFNMISNDEEDMKKQKRAERFHIAGGNPDADNLKKIERAKRFGMVIPEAEEEKKKLRAAKFGLSESNDFLKNKKVKQN